MTVELQEGYEMCRQIMRAHGKSYYFATSLFGDVWMKRSTWALYAFFRIPDDIVDEQVDRGAEAMTRELDIYTADWRAAMERGSALDVRMNVMVDTFKRLRIPIEYGESFLTAMRSDITKHRYATYAELENYMYGSAGVVGYMMAYVIGFVDRRALEYSKTLGYAMQLTNFLRDLDADYAELGRVYMPEDELMQFGLSVEDIAQKKWSPEFRAFMQFQVQRTWQLYAEGNKCLPLLSPKGRFAYKMASVLYARILTKLEQQDYNPFIGRASTSLAEKVWLLVKTKVVG
jgi:phytoene synthase